MCVSQADNAWGRVGFVSVCSLARICVYVCVVAGAAASWCKCVIFVVNYGVAAARRLPL